MTKREAFEAWVGKGLHLEQIPTGAPFAGDYRSIVMQTRWDAWQAACAWQREQDAKMCEKNILREAGYGGRFEGYGAFDDWMTGKECADKVRGGG